MTAAFWDFLKGKIENKKFHKKDSMKKLSDYIKKSRKFNSLIFYLRFFLRQNDTNN
jgi:hypothetical protein